MNNIRIEGTKKKLNNFINHKRAKMLSWCDWNIPLHWGAMSDPFQPVETKYKNSLSCLNLLVDAQYPFIVSSKSILPVQDNYLELFSKANCVYQMSLATPEYDKIEPGAPPFHKRLMALETLSAKVKRTIVRIQPYIANYHKSIMESIKLFSDCGAFGIVIEGIKLIKKQKGMIKLNSDFVYPYSLLKSLFAEIKERAHSLGMKFYCGENRLRELGDDLTCCGVEGLGWKVNTANFNSFLFQPDRVWYSEKMTKGDASVVFLDGFCQSTIGLENLKNKTYKELMESAFKSRLRRIFTDRR